MNRPPADHLPERLLASDATDFERRILHAAVQKKPSSSSSARMARALGITAATVGTATTATTLAAGAAATKVLATGGAAAAWPWLTIGVVGLVVAGAIVGTRVAGEPQVSPPAVAAPVTPPAPVVIAPVKPVLTEEPPVRVAAPNPRIRAATTTSELREQVALIDSARQAVSEGAGERALEILRRYVDRYPNGSFRPEATAIRIEALMKVGREAEGRALAERFVTENRGSLLARRVADVAGLNAR
jgi:hypothetical protein